MKNRKIFITLLVIVFSTFTLKGQDNMVIHLVGSNDITIAIDDIQRITFDGDNMLLKTVNGVENNYFIDDIACITFFDDPTTIKEIPKNIEVNVYVNASGEIVAESPHQIKQLILFDINGRVLSASDKSSLNINSLSTGIYLLQVETTEGTVAKKFIKNR
jgi:hypothetical protein